jgi:hypothetical protein
MQWEARAVRFPIVVFILTAMPAALPVRADDRAKILHDTYCMMCHDTRVYTRNTRLANDFTQIRDQVDRWQDNVSLNWSAVEIDLVANYLARRFYNVPCPAAC